MKILALDLGKFKTRCCFFDTETRKHEFLNAATDRNYLTTVFQKHKIDLVVMEACGPSGWINDLAVGLGLKVRGWQKSFLCIFSQNGNHHRVAAKKVPKVKRP